MMWDLDLVKVMSWMKLDYQLGLVKTSEGDLMSELVLVKLEACSINQSQQKIQKPK